MSKKIIDCFGRSQNSVDFGGKEPLPYRLTEEDGATYICFFDTPKRAIHRIKDGVVEFAYGAWEDRANLQYHPINSCLEVEA